MFFIIGMEIGIMINKKILLVGHGRHGKDTVADILDKDYGLSFQSSSMFCAEHVVFPVLKDLYNYSTVDQCFNDRHQHRTEWFQLISEYCSEDAARLGKNIFNVSDVYCGLRNKREFHSLRNQKVFDFSIWVDRSDHLPPEDKSSNNIEPWMADYIVDNNGSLTDLRKNVHDLMDNLGVE